MSPPSSDGEGLSVQAKERILQALFLDPGQQEVAQKALGRIEESIRKYREYIDRKRTHPNSQKQRQSIERLRRILKGFDLKSLDLQPKEDGVKTAEFDEETVKRIFHYMGRRADDPFEAGKKRYKKYFLVLERYLETINRAVDYASKRIQPDPGGSNELEREMWLCGQLAACWTEVHPNIPFRTSKNKPTLEHKRLPNRDKPNLFVSTIFDVAGIKVDGSSRHYIMNTVRKAQHQAKPKKSRRDERSEKDYKRK